MSKYCWIAVALLVGVLASADECQLYDAITNTCFACKTAGFQPAEDGRCAARVTSINGCLVYASNDKCKRCSLGHRLNALTGACQKDYTGCLAFSNDNTCLKCGFGTRLENGRCAGILNCETYDPTNPKFCRACSQGFDCFDIACFVNDGCITTLDNGGCAECTPGLVSSGFACYPHSKLLSGCAVIDGKGGCQYCQTGLNLQDGKCSPSVQTKTDVPSIEIKNLRSDSQPAIPSAAPTQPFVSIATAAQVAIPSVTQAPVTQTSPLPAVPQSLPVTTFASQTLSNAPSASTATISPAAITISVLPPPADNACKIVEDGTNTCLACNYGYYLSSSKCIPVSKLCDGYNLMTGDCLGCISGYKLNGQGGCIEDKPQDPNCNIYKDGKCTSCKYGFILKGSVCSPVSPLCQGYDLQNGKCLGCLPNYTLKEGHCIETKNILQPIVISPKPEPSAVVVVQPAAPQPVQPQPAALIVTTSPSDSIQASKSQASTVSYTVSPQPQTPSRPTTERDPRCKKFDIDNSCLECSPGYFLNSAKKCKLVNQLCATYNPTDGSCTKCYNGYKLENGKCITRLADPNCKELVDNICKKCSNGFYLNKDNRCTPFNPQCATSDPSNGDCLSCYTGYTLRDGKCMIGAQDQHCKVFESGVCKVCASGYYTNNGKCTQASTVCATFDPQNGNCLTCYNGYTLSGTTCVVKAADPNCKEYMKGECSKCSNGYFIKAGKCTQVSNLCAKFDPVTGDCTECYNGYLLNSGKCELSTIDSHCKSFKDGVCQVCVSGYFLSSAANKGCIPLNPLCRVSNQTDGSCLMCYGGYTLTSNGLCIVPTCTDPNCAQKSGAQCLSCNDRYYLEQGVCTAVNPQCYTYEMSTGRCTNCFTGFFVSKGQCLPSVKSEDSNCQTADLSGHCIKCHDGYHPSKADGKCQPVSLLCANFDYALNKCTSCLQGYVLQDDDCIFPSLGVDVHCTHYTNSYCDKCQDGYTLTNYQCVQAGC